MNAGEVLDDLRVLGVAAERDQRHPQVVLDEEQHRLARLAGQLQPIDARPWPSARSRARGRRRATCRRRAAAAPAPAAPAGCSSSEHVAEALPVRLVGVREPLEVADRQQRVLVDRVLVVEVADHPPRDRLEFREHTAEQPAVVHLRQPRVEPVPRLEQRDAAPRDRAPPERSRRHDSDRRAAGCTRASLRRPRCRRRSPPETRQSTTPGSAPPGSDRGSGCRRATVRGSGRPAPAPSSCAHSSDRLTMRAWRK